MSVETRWVGIAAPGPPGPPGPPSSYMVNVRDFGAAGDGETDDTTAILAAIDEAKELGGSAYSTAGARALYIPAGIYAISAQLDFGTSCPHLSVQGAGQALSVFKALTPEAHLWFSNSRCRIGGFGFDGNDLAEVGIVAVGGTNATWFDFLVLNCVGDAIRLHGCQNSIFDNGYITDCGGNGLVLDDGFGNNVLRKWEIAGTGKHMILLTRTQTYAVVGYTDPTHNVILNTLCEYAQTAESGTAAVGGSTSALVDTTKAWAVNAWKDAFVTIDLGGANQRGAKVLSNTATALTVAASGFPLAPDGLSYQLNWPLVKAEASTGTVFGHCALVGIAGEYPVVHITRRNQGESQSQVEFHHLQTAGATASSTFCELDGVSCSVRTSYDDSYLQAFKKGIRLLHVNANLYGSMPRVQGVTTALEFAGGASLAANCFEDQLYYQHRHTSLAAADSIERVFVTGDTLPRFYQLADGAQWWGSGSATPDTTLYRHQADHLRTADSLQVDQGLWSTAVTTKTANYALLKSDQFVQVDATTGPITITAGGGFIGKEWTIQKIDSSTNAVTVVRAGGGTINGVTSLVLTQQWETLTIRAGATGAIWYVTARSGGSVAAFNVRDYGAKGDGTTDDKAAIQSAIDACGAAGGGTVYFPPGTYRLTTTTTDSTYIWSLMVSYDNVELRGAGPASKIFLDVATNAAMFCVDGGAKAARVGGNVNVWHTYRAFVGSVAPAAYNLTGTIAEGASSVTLFTAAQASNFAPGDYVAIRTGQVNGASATGQPDAEINVVKAINAGTGVIDLEVPTVKPYAQEYYVAGTTGVTSTAVTANLAPFQLVKLTDRILKGFRIADLALETRATRHAIFGGDVDNFVAENVSGLFRGGASFLSLGVTRNQQVRACTLTHRALSGWVYAMSLDAGSSFGQWTDLTITADAGVPYFHLHEGAAQCLVRDSSIAGPAVASNYNSISIRARAYRHTIANVSILGGGNTAVVTVDNTCTGGGVIRDLRIVNSLATASVSVGAFSATTPWMVDQIDSRLPVLVTTTEQNGPAIHQVLAAWVADNQQNPTIGVLPAYSFVSNIWVDVTEVFNSDGTDLVTVGFDGGGENWFATNVDVSTTGTKAVTLGVSARRYAGTARTLEAYYTNSGSEPTTGRALVVVEYYRVPFQIP